VVVDCVTNSFANTVPLSAGFNYNPISLDKPPFGWWHNPEYRDSILQIRRSRISVPEAPFEKKKKKKRQNFTLEQAMKALRGSTGIALLFL